MSSADSKRVYQKVTHCIFDNDGTLMGKLSVWPCFLYRVTTRTPSDTEYLYAKAVQSVLDEYGEVYTGDLQSQCMGLPVKVACKLLIEEFDLFVDVDDLREKIENQEHRLLGHVQLKPGVRRLLWHLHEHRVPMAIATSSSQKCFNRRATPHGRLIPAFHHIVCGDDPELVNGKPSPDIFLLAASRFKPKVDPNCCLVFEDSPMGVQAGVAAGMQVVMTPDPRMPLEKTRNATLVLNSMEDFQPELFGLPPYDCVPKFTFG